MQWLNMNDKFIRIFLFQGTETRNQKEIVK